MKLKGIILFISFLLILPSFSLGNKKTDIVIGFGGGYSSGKGEALIDIPSNFYFREENALKHCWNLNLQYFFSRKLGLQMEYSKQIASYFSHLEWYEATVYDPVTFTFQEYELNHIETPYRKSYSVSSLILSFVYAERRYMEQKTFPYFFYGIALYFMEGDQDLVLNRYKLGPKKTHTGMKMGLGLKHYFSSSKPKFGLNFRLSGFMVNLKNSNVGSSASDVPFSLNEWLENKKIVRVSGLDSIIYLLSADISLEFSF